MRTHSRLLLAGFTAALTLSLATANASAGRLSVSTRTFTITWASLNQFTTGGAGFISCPFTLSGSFHSSTIAKVSGALIGRINRGTIATASCTGGRETVNQESLPWHIRYEAFRGTLPNITGYDVEVIGVKMTLDVGFVCTMQSTAANPWVLITNVFPTSGRVTSVTPDPGVLIPLTGSGGFCAGAVGNASFEGTSNSVTALTIRLI